MKRSRESSNKSDESSNKHQKKEYEVDVFFRACYDGDLDLVKNWLSLGKVNVVEAKDSDGRSGIHFAARNGKVDIVKVLLQNGADVNAIDKENIAALHHAAMASLGIL